MTYVDFDDFDVPVHIELVPKPRPNMDVVAKSVEDSVQASAALTKMLLAIKEGYRVQSIVDGDGRATNSYLLSFWTSDSLAKVIFEIGREISWDLMSSLPPGIFDRSITQAEKNLHYFETNVDRNEHREIFINLEKDKEVIKISTMDQNTSEFVELYQISLRQKTLFERLRERLGF